jgi:hypothetical protein
MFERVLPVRRIVLRIPESEYVNSPVLTKMLAGEAIKGGAANHRAETSPSADLQLLDRDLPESA